MDIYYNHYIMAVKNEIGIRFFIGNSIFGENKYLFKLNEEQMLIMEQLINGSAIKEDTLKRTLGNKNYMDLIKLNVLLNAPVDRNEMYSRSKAFYFNNEMYQVHEKLKNKKVMILGVGGIGTHVAWNIATMGVGKLVIVDGDVVEISNMNRQILFDVEDIGKRKVSVLQKKLSMISKTKIQAIHKFIDSQELLDSLIASEKPDLIIKSLDSPTMFPFWLDAVCEKYEVPYITGITLNGIPMIGPTYIPGVSSSYTDFFKDEDISYYFGGIGSSLGVIFYQISGEISLEAFKYLTEVGDLKFVDKVKMVDYLTGKTAIIHPKNNNPFDKIKLIHRIFILVATISIISIIGYVSNSSLIILFNYLNVIFLPIMMFHKKNNVTQGIFIGSFVLSLFNTMLAAYNLYRDGNPINLLQVVPTFSILVGVVSILSCLIGILAYRLKNKIFKGSEDT